MLAFKPPGNDMFELRADLIESGNQRFEWLNEYPFSNWLEKTMEWGDRIAVKHNWVVWDSGVKPVVSGNPTGSGVDYLFHQSGVNWYRWGPYKEKFLPSSGDPYNLTGYPWCTEEFFKQYRDFAYHLHTRSLTPDPSGRTLNTVYGWPKWSPSGINEISESGKLKQRDFWSNIAYGGPTLPVFSQLRLVRKSGKSSQSYDTLAEFDQYVNQYGEPYLLDKVVEASGIFHFPGISLSEVVWPGDGDVFVDGVEYVLNPHFFQVSQSGMGFGQYDFLNASGFVNYSGSWEGFDVGDSNLTQEHFLTEYVNGFLDYSSVNKGFYSAGGVGNVFDSIYRTEFHYCITPIANPANASSGELAEAYPLRSIFGVSESDELTIATEHAEAYYRESDTFIHAIPYTFGAPSGWEFLDTLRQIREFEYNYYYNPSNFNALNRNHKIVYGFINYSGSIVGPGSIYGRNFIATSETDVLVGEALRRGDYYDLINLGATQCVYPSSSPLPNGNFNGFLWPIPSSLHAQNNPLTFLYPSGYNGNGLNPSYMTRQHGVASGSLVDLVHHIPPSGATCLFIAEILETPSGVDGNTNSKGIGFYEPYNFRDSDGNLPSPFQSLSFNPEHTSDIRNFYSIYYFVSEKPIFIGTVIRYAVTSPNPTTQIVNLTEYPWVCVSGLISPPFHASYFGQIPIECALPGHDGFINVKVKNYDDHPNILFPWNAKFGSTVISVADNFIDPWNVILVLDEIGQLTNAKPDFDIHHYKQRVDVGSGTIPVGVGLLCPSSSFSDDFYTGYISLLKWGYGDAEFWSI